MMDSALRGNPGFAASNEDFRGFKENVVRANLPAPARVRRSKIAFQQSSISGLSADGLPAVLDNSPAAAGATAAGVQLRLLHVLAAHLRAAHPRADPGQLLPGAVHRQEHQAQEAVGG